MKKLFFTILTICFTAVEIFAVDFKFDGLARNRYEYLVNNSDAGFSGKDEKSYFRFKFTGGVKAEFEDIVNIYARMATESRSYIKNAGGNTQYDINEILLDNFYIHFQNISDSLEMKAGRFDLSGRNYGEGFLIEDGTPLDGSRTFYFNGIQLKYNMKKSSIEFIGVYNPEYDDLPIINNKDRKLNLSRDIAAILYGHIFINENVYLEPYYISKEEKFDKINEANSINTFGTYFKYKYNNAALRVQAAMQSGKYNNESKRAFGGYVFTDLDIKEVFKPLTLGYVYLSGDEKGSWNPLFSRGTFMSEIAAALYAKESAYGYWSNLQMFNAELNFKPYNNVSIKTAYMYLVANTSFYGVSNIFGSGKSRGSLFVLHTRYNFSKNISSQIRGEYFIPGDFYYDGVKDAVFVRAEIAVKI